MSKILHKFNKIFGITKIYFYIFLILRNLNIFIIEYMSTEKKNKAVRLNVNLTPDARKKYKQYCLKKDFVMSERIRELIEKDLKGEIK